MAANSRIGELGEAGLAAAAAVEWDYAGKKPQENPVLGIFSRYQWEGFVLANGMEIPGWFLQEFWSPKGAASISS